MVYGEMRAAIERAERCRLPEVASALWKAYGAGGLTDGEAEELSALLEARQGVARAVTTAPTIAAAVARVAAVAQARSRAGSRPRTAESLGRRRRWVAAGFMPPAIAAGFTSGEVAALAVIAAEVGRRGTCTLPFGAIAALAGVSESTAKRALRQARATGLVSVTERRIARDRNDTNVVRIISREWTAWLRLRLPRAARALSGPPGVQIGAPPSIEGQGIAGKAARTGRIGRSTACTSSPPQGQRIVAA